MVYIRQEKPNDRPILNCSKIQIGSLQTKKFDTHVDKTMIFKTLKK